MSFFSGTAFIQASLINFNLTLIKLPTLSKIKDKLEGGQFWRLGLQNSETVL